MANQEYKIVVVNIDGISKITMFLCELENVKVGDYVFLEGQTRAYEVNEIKCFTEETLPCSINSLKRVLRKLEDDYGVEEEKTTPIVQQVKETIDADVVINVKSDEEEKDEFDDEKINQINEYIFALAEERNIWILDMAEEFANKEGQLPDEYTTNGIRFEKDTYQIWSDYIVRHKAHK